VLLTADPRVREQLLHVEEAARYAVELVLRLPCAEQRARDGDLGELDREQARGVVDGQLDLGATERGARSGPGEDDVVHLPAPQGTRPLRAEHPRDRIDEVLQGFLGTPEHAAMLSSFGFTSDEIATFNRSARPARREAPPR